MLSKKEKFEILIDFTEKKYGTQKTFLHYTKDYELLFAIILSAQSKDDIVNKVTKQLFERYKELEDYKNADIEDIFLIIKEVGLVRQKALYIKNSATILVDKFNKQIPLDRELLTILPGVGTKVSGVFLGELYDFHFLPVDTHISRIAKKLDLVTANATPDNIEKTLLSLLPKGENSIRVHKHLISFGRDICLPNKNRNCYLCPLEKVCKHKIDNLK